MTKPLFPTSDFADQILRGNVENIVWGGTESLTALEWQRQVPASFFVDTTWDWWGTKTFYGKPVRSPSVIEGYDPERAAVWHNYRYHAFAGRVPAFLARLGNFKPLEPLSLQTLAHIALNKDCVRDFSFETSRRFIETVNDELVSRLVSIDQLGGPSHRLPSQETVSFLASYTSRAYLEKALKRVSENQMDTLRPLSGHACLCVSSISPGGAERQICNLAVALRRRGMIVTILCFVENVKSSHTAYLDSLRKEGIPVEIVCPPLPSNNPETLVPLLLEDVPAEVLSTLWHVPGIFVFKALSLYQALRRLRPSLFVSYLDGNNIPGGLAALLSGVPHIMLSARSAARPQFDVEPLHRLQEILADSYRILASHPRITLSANSPGAAESYAEWLKLPRTAFKVVPNCVSEEFTTPLPPCFCETKRFTFRLEPGQPFILGVFRLHPVKRPMDFVRVIAAVREKHPNIKAAICGAFDFEVAEIRALIHDLGLDDILFLLGAMNDVPAMMQTATILLHTAETEGSPNAVIEAQASGLPVVAADNPGVADCLHETWRPLSPQPGDIEGLAKACCSILENVEDSAHRASFVRKAILESRSLEALGETMLGAIKTLNAPPPKPAFGPRKKIIALTGENENGALKTHAASFNLRLQQHGYETQLIDLLEPDGFQALSQALETRDEIAFIYAFAGVGSRFEAPEGGNLWAFLRVPFVCFWYDPPAYNYKQHMVDSPYVLHIYHIKDHYETRQKYLQSASRAIYIPSPISLPLGVREWRWKDRKKSILFAKTAYNPEDILSFWKSFPQRLCGVLERLAEEACVDRNIDLPSATVKEFETEGVPWRDHYEDFFGVMHEVDRYIRAWRSDKLGRALLKYPAKIIGRGWDYLASPKNRAEILPPVEGKLLLPLIETHRVTANTNPLWRDGLHERVWMGLGCGNVALTDRTEKTDELFGGLKSYVGFDWGDNLDEAIETALARAEDETGYIAYSRPALRDYAEHESAQFIERVEQAVIAQLGALPR